MDRVVAIGIVNSDQVLGTFSRLSKNGLLIIYIWGVRGKKSKVTPNFYSLTNWKNGIISSERPDYGKN